MKPRIASLLAALALLAAPACQPAPAATARPVTLTVMAAASLTGAFEAIGDEFERAHPGVTLQFNFAGSQLLAQQIAQGAPADVFASANRAQMDAAVTSGDIDPAAVTIFAANRLVVVLPKDNPARVETLQDLAAPGLALDLPAKEVPAGRYALDFLDKAAADPAFGAGFKDAVLANVVSYEDNVRAVMTKVQLGEADAGIVYATDAAAAAGAVRVLEIPDSLNVPAAYPIAAIKGSKAPELAQAFVDTVRSPAGQDILKQYGFSPAE